MRRKSCIDAFAGAQRIFPQLGAYLKHNQLIANYISLELARGEAQIPSFTPPISPNITAALCQRRNIQRRLRGGIPVDSQLIPQTTAAPSERTDFTSMAFRFQS